MTTHILFQLCDYLCVCHVQCTSAKVMFRIHLINSEQDLRFITRVTLGPSTHPLFIHHTQIQSGSHVFGP